jgi:hypothetical protein
VPDGGHRPPYRADHSLYAHCRNLWLIRVKETVTPAKAGVQSKIRKSLDSGSYSGRSSGAGRNDEPEAYNSELPGFSVSFGQADTIVGKHISGTTTRAIPLRHGLSAVPRFPYSLWSEQFLEGSFHTGDAFSD